MFSKTIKANNYTGLLISLSMIISNILTPVHAENSTSNTQLVHVNTLYNTDNMCLPNDEELNYITCKNLYTPYKDDEKAGYHMECEGFDKVKGTVVRFEDEDGNFEGTCVLRYLGFKKLAYYCSNKNNTNNTVTKYDVIGKFDSLVFIPLCVNFIVYILYKFLKPPAYCYNIFYLFIVYTNYRFLSYIEVDYWEYFATIILYYGIFNMLKYFIQSLIYELRYIPSQKEVDDNHED